LPIYACSKAVHTYKKPNICTNGRSLQQHYSIISIMRKLIFTVVLSILSMGIFAQPPGGGNRGGAGRGGQNATIGHFYGKFVDSKTNKPIEAATIVLYGNKFDTVTKKPKEVVLKTVLSANNGDFSLEGLPIFGNFKMKVSAIGYKSLDKTLKFDVKMPQGGAAGGGMESVAGMTDVDLGNIKLEQNPDDLGNVTVTATKQLFEMGIDRKIFNVDKNLVSTGQTATEIMKSIPSLNVDIDGNVTLRNASPQIFVDGRPTTLTLDQIPADIIDKVEIITNPSAKFDASGGNAGILNIVLKKNKKTGYNGGLRVGADSRGRVNAGGDINLRQNKLNFFLSGQFNQRKSKANSETNRNNFLSTNSLFKQNTNSTNTGYFGFLRGGFDYLIDNRNTLSFSANYNRGQFDNDQTQTVDSIIYKSPVYNSTTYASTMSASIFRNFGSQLSYKHNFTKNGHNLSGDINFNSSSNDNNSTLSSTTTPLAASKYPSLVQQSVANGSNRFFTIQSDYENPLTENTKFEAGARAAIRSFKNNNDVFQYDNNISKFVQSIPASSRYRFNDQVYAAYATYTFKVKKWNYQLGLRTESSNYTGTLLRANGTDSATFKVNYPISLFPSAFITYKLTQTQDFQLNYSRRVNRPNFFQLMPFADYTTDPQNISIGYAGLKPEFTNSFEVSYSNAYKKGANFLASLYFKQTDDLITRYTYRDVNKITGDSAFFYTYINANKSQTFGLELTNKMAVTKWWDLTLNVNFYNSKIDATIPGTSVTNELVSWFGKMNSSFKVAKGLSIQFSGDYQAKTVLPQSDGGGGGRRGGGGGMMFGGGGAQPTAQGYVLPRYSFDFGIRKDWTWKNGQSGSLNLSVNDIFKTQVYKTYSESPYFTQNSERTRDQQIVRLNFNYRFGKFDVQLFKRKNTKADQGGGNEMAPQ
jgi:outer membrane receptor protein involved in Fe transport